MSSKRIATGDTIFASQLFTRQELVGRGAYGAVYKGIENATQQVVAIKVLNLDTEEEDVSDIQREIATLSQLKNCDSQNITRYHGSFLNGTKLWIVMDYAAGGSIRSLLQALTRIDEKCIAVIAREVLQALGYLHKHGIIHRDIKAANILLTDEGRVQLCDFGVAGQVTMNSLKRNSFVGTPYWMAPEVIKEGQTYDFKADIWSLGITIYEIATGNPPFADQDPMRAVSLIPKSRPAQLEGDWSPAMKEFVALCLHEEPNERPSAEDLLKTKWIKSTSKNSLVLLKDLVAKYEHHKLESALNKDETGGEIDIDHELENFDMEVDPDAWRFDTAKTVPKPTPSRASSISRPSTDPSSDLTTVRSPIQSAQDSGVVMQGRNGKQQDFEHKRQESGAPSSSAALATSPTVKAKANPSSPPTSKKRFPLISQPSIISHESHPLLRLFMHHKSASEEDLSTSHSHHSQGIQLTSAPMTLTIPNLDEVTNARLASKSPVPGSESSATFDHFHPPQLQYSAAQAEKRASESTRLPFGFNMSKPFRIDRRPSAPVLMGSNPGPDFPFHSHGMLNRGPVGSSPLTSPRAVAPPPQSSILSNMHMRNGLPDLDSAASSLASISNKGSQSHEIIIPSQHQCVPQTNGRPNSTPASPALPPMSVMGSNLGPSQPTGASRDISRLNGARRPSPTIPQPVTIPQQQQQQQQQQQSNQSRSQVDARSNLPPQIPHRKASLDFSQNERQTLLRPTLPLRPPSAAAVRSSTFHGLDSAPLTNIAIGNEALGSFANGYGLSGLSIQPINISEEKLPPFGHSAAHLRLLNALPDTAPPTANGFHQGSSTSSEKDGQSPALSTSGDPTFGQMNNASSQTHATASSASSTASSVPSPVPNSSTPGGGFAATMSNASQNAVLPRPGLRTVGSSENFARRIRSASMLRRAEEQQENMSKSGFQPSRPPQPNGNLLGQTQQQQQHGQYQSYLQGQYQQQQFSYGHDPNQSDMGRYRRASSPRQRSTSMTNLNGGHSAGHSVIMIPAKKSSVDDYSPNPLLLPPSPSTTRFIAPSSLNVSALSSSPLRPTLHSMASSSSLSSSYGSISGAMVNSQSVGGGNSNVPFTQLQQHQQMQYRSGSISGPPGMSSISTSPTSQPQVTSNGHHLHHHHQQLHHHHHSHQLPQHQPYHSNNMLPSTFNSISSNHSAGGVKSLMSTSSPSNQGSDHFANGASSNASHLAPSSFGQSNNNSNSLVASNSLQNLQQPLQQVPMHLLLVTPEPRPLHMDALRRNDDLLDELQMTVNDLSQWLEVFETGIKNVRPT
ncbi:hypothetical protein EMPS_10431 [Entomortierella parvispora]|uniref:non-specific serine/threonine protein kinase n=1 Tax=Entomortierella parvispora TaxID=205924 RepID=A0A9P3HK08_9FUNG|nr:hypothetical protein EMPS_10431 [Entomortierella parvispora]